MSTSELLEGVLEGSQIPHQPLLIITETSTHSSLPLFTEIIRRSEQAGRGSVLITALHPSTTILPRGSSSRVIDLTNAVPGFGETEGLGRLEERVESDFRSVGEKASIYIDALDILAEDHSISATLRLFRNLLQLVKDSKSPSRLVLLLPASSPLLSSLIPPTTSSTLTLLSPHPPQLLSYLSKAYLTPIEASPKFWQILETAQSRHLTDDLSFKGEAGLEVGQVGNMIIQTLVRKAAGGSKGISRSLEAFSLGAVKRVSDIMEIMPMNAPTPGSGSGPTGQPPKTHADLDLPFNLNLTDSQKAARMGVPLPYAHEGEGAAVDLEIDEDDDEDDEEI